MFLGAFQAVCNAMVTPFIEYLHTIEWTTRTGEYKSYDLNTNGLYIGILVKIVIGVIFYK